MFSSRNPPQLHDRRGVWRDEGARALPVGSRAMSRPAPWPPASRRWPASPSLRPGRPFCAPTKPTPDWVRLRPILCRHLRHATSPPSAGTRASISHRWSRCRSPPGTRSSRSSSTDVETPSSTGMVKAGSRVVLDPQLPVRGPRRRALPPTCVSGQPSRCDQVTLAVTSARACRPATARTPVAAGPARWWRTRRSCMRCPMGSPTSRAVLVEPLACAVRGRRAGSPPAAATPSSSSAPAPSAC